MKPPLSAVLALGLPLVLTACGFQPLYGERGAGASASAALQDMDIAPQTTRTGQLVRNELLSGVAPAAARGGRYILDFTTTEKEETAIVTFKSGARQKRYILNVSYTLTRRGSSKVLTSGKTFAEASYTITRQPAADMQARIHAAETAARVAAGDIRTRLAAWFSARG